MAACPIPRVVTVIGALLLGSAVIAGCARGDAQSTRDGPAIPTFAVNPSSLPMSPTRDARSPLVPHDCDQALSHNQVPVLLGLPLDSVEVHTTIDIPDPRSRRLERVSCRYTHIGSSASLLDFSMSAFADPAAARRQTDINVADEQSSAGPGVPSPIGGANGRYFVDGDERILMVDYGRATLTVVLQAGVVGEGEVRAVLVDLAQRVLPTLTS